MRYLNLLLILIILGCYSGIGASNFNLTEKTTPSCHENSSLQKNHHNPAEINFQLNENQERPCCFIYAVTYQVDYKSINPILTASIIDYYSLHINIENNIKFRDNSLNNHSPPQIFISNSSFLI